MNFPITVAVPWIFFKDHLNRGCGQTAKVLQETKKSFWVELDEEAWTDLYSDADYYISLIGSEDHEGNESVVRSAVRTMAHLQRVMKAGA